MKLELKHLAAYLQYDLKFLTADKEIVSVTVIDFYRDFIRLGLHDKNNDTGYFYNEKLEDVKPILRPLSDLTKENMYQIQRKGIDISTFDWSLLITIVRLGYGAKVNIEHLSYRVFNALLEMKFDLFHLIPNRLAIDINTLNKI